MGTERSPAEAGARRVREFSRRSITSYSDAYSDDFEDDGSVRDGNLGGESTGPNFGPGGGRSFPAPPLSPGTAFRGAAPSPLGESGRSLVAEGSSHGAGSSGGRADLVPSWLSAAVDSAVVGTTGSSPVLSPGDTTPDRPGAPTADVWAGGDDFDVSLGARLEAAGSVMASGTPPTRARSRLGDGLDSTWGSSALPRPGRSLTPEGGSSGATSGTGVGRGGSAGTEGGSQDSAAPWEHPLMRKLRVEKERAERLRAIREDPELAATTLQARWRGRSTRVRLRRAREAEERRRANAAAVAIQTRHRGVAVRRRRLLPAMRAEATARAAAIAASVLYLQAAARAWKARKKLRALREAKQQVEDQRRSRSIFAQRRGPGPAAITEAERRQRARWERRVHEVFLSRHATAIQKWVRRRQVGKRVEERRREQPWEVAAQLVARFVHEAVEAAESFRVSAGLPPLDRPPDGVPLPDEDPGGQPAILHRTSSGRRRPARRPEPGIPAGEGEGGAANSGASSRGGSARAVPSLGQGEPARTLNREQSASLRILRSAGGRRAASAGIARSQSARSARSAATTSSVAAGVDEALRTLLDAAAAAPSPDPSREATPAYSDSFYSESPSSRASSRAPSAARSARTTSSQAQGVEDALQGLLDQAMRAQTAELAAALPPPAPPPGVPMPDGDGLRASSLPSAASESAAGGAVAAAEWKCSLCKKDNAPDTNTCGLCGRKGPQDETGRWACAKCQYRNLPGAVRCAGCWDTASSPTASASSRRSRPSRAAASPLPPGAGEHGRAGGVGGGGGGGGGGEAWECSLCFQSNPSGLTVCRICQRARGEWQPAQALQPSPRPDVRQIRLPPGPAPPLPELPRGNPAEPAAPFDIPITDWSTGSKLGSALEAAREAVLQRDAANASLPALPLEGAALAARGEGGGGAVSDDAIFPLPFGRVAPNTRGPVDAGPLTARSGSSVDWGVGGGAAPQDGRVVGHGLAVHPEVAAAAVATALVDPETGYLLDMATGAHLVDAVTGGYLAEGGYVVDPQTGVFMVDAATGAYVTAGGVLVDPATGEYVINPKTGGLVGVGGRVRDPSEGFHRLSYPSAHNTHRAQAAGDGGADAGGGAGLLVPPGADWGPVLPPSHRLGPGGAGDEAARGVGGSGSPTTGSRRPSRDPDPAEAAARAERARKRREALGEWDIPQDEAAPGAPPALGAGAGRPATAVVVGEVRRLIGLGAMGAGGLQALEEGYGWEHEQVEAALQRVVGELQERERDAERRFRAATRAAEAAGREAVARAAEEMESQLAAEGPSWRPAAKPGKGAVPPPAECPACAALLGRRRCAGCRRTLDANAPKAAPLVYSKAYKHMSPSPPEGGGDGGGSGRAGERVPGPGVGAEAEGKAEAQAEAGAGAEAYMYVEAGAGADAYAEAETSVGPGSVRGRHNPPVFPYPWGAPRPREGRDAHAPAVPSHGLPPVRGETRPQMDDARSPHHLHLPARSIVAALAKVDKRGAREQVSNAARERAAAAREAEARHIALAAKYN